jgi:hypothetical protein
LPKVDLVIVTCAAAMVDIERSIMERSFIEHTHE